MTELIEGTKDEIIKALHDASDHLTYPLAFEARAAAGKIASGVTSVQVGQVEYRVRRADG